MPWDDNLSEEQRAIALDSARIKIVRAGPGAGKTRLFVGALQQAMEDWPHRRAGIAALSFTNIAQQEIAKRAGTIASPHLTTTIDSFVLRFIIRPFAHLITQRQQGTRLLPSIIAKQFADDVQIGTSNAERSRLSDIRYIGHDKHGNVLMTGVTAYTTRPVHEQRRELVLHQKQLLWQRTGLLTHSDTHYIAYCILHAPAHGDRVAAIIARRFPTILVDEYQDTNYFLALTLKKLFAQPSLNGLIVGDTDQAIYEFGGAHPRLFDDLATIPGAKSFSLRKTYRCPKSVARVATLLAQSHNPVEPTKEQGYSMLVAHDGSPGVLSTIITGLLRPAERVAILARRTDTIDALKGAATCVFPGGCKLAAQLSSAANILPRSGSKAAQLTGAALAMALLDHCYPTKATLERHQITPRAWRKAVWHLLSTAASTIGGETWYDWVLRLRPALRTAAEIVGSPVEQRRIMQLLGANKSMQSPRQPVQPGPGTAWPAATVFSTVHGVKGDEFEIVALYYPKPKARGTLRCVTKQWWGDQHTEERRVAFVATTRAKRVYVLCVHRDSYEALQHQQRQFVASFSEHKPILVPRAAPRQTRKL